MPGSFPLGVVIRGVRTIDVMHDLGQIPGRRLHQQMIVIVHQTIGVNDAV